MRVIGLTGSMAMGKSTTAAMFRRRGVPVYDADCAVHRLYAGEAVAAVAAAFPGVAPDGTIDRGLLAERLSGDPAALAKLEAIVHPLVRSLEATFLENCRAKGATLALLDVPLLLETGGAERVNVVVVVTAPEQVQKQRLLARPGMTEARLATLLKRQMPDREKRLRAHAVIDTGRGLDAAERQVAALLRALAGPR